METSKIRLRTYRQVWLQEHMIYQIERVRLPFPVSLRQAGLFAVALVVMAIFSRLPGMDQISPLLRYVVIPAALTWFLTKQRLDGKPPLRWLLSWIKFAVSPKRLNRFQSVTEHGKIRIRAPIGYRLKG